MRGSVVGLVLAALLLSSSGVAGAQGTLSVSKNPGVLTIQTAIAGSNPTSVTDASTTYTVSIPPSGSTSRITGQLNTNMPAGVTLTINLASSGGVSVGAVALTTAAQNLVTGIPKKHTETSGITYTLSATAAAGVIASTNRTVTLTVVSP